MCRRCTTIKQNILIKNIIYLIPILFLISVGNNPEQKQIYTWNKRMVEYQVKEDLAIDKINYADTLTNWQFYLDDKLIYKSHTGSLNDQIVKIDTTEQYDFFKFQIFYDFHNKVDNRKIEMIADDELFKVFTQTNDTFLPFEIPKYDFEIMEEKYFEKEIVLKFYDPVNPNGLEVGKIKFVSE